MFAVIKMELSGKSVYGPVLKTTPLSAHAQNHASPERCRKSFSATTITGSNFGIVTAFRAIFSHIFKANAQERPLMNFRSKL